MLFNVVLFLLSFTFWTTVMVSNYCSHLMKKMRTKTTKMKTKKEKRNNKKAKLVLLLNLGLARISNSAHMEED